MTDFDFDFDTSRSAQSAERTSINRRRMRRIVPVFALLLIGAIIAINFWLVTTIQIVVSPEDASEQMQIKQVEGMLFPWGDVVVLLEQHGKIEVSAVGYSAEELTLDTADSAPLRNVQLRPLPGILTITVDAPGRFNLAIDGNPIIVDGSTVETELDQGLHRVTLTGLSIQPVTSEVDIEGFGRRQELSLVGVESRSFLEVSTNPTTASIALNGQPLGVGSFNGPVGTGTHVLQISAEGYQPKTVPFRVDLNRTANLGVIVLDPGNVRLNIRSSPSDAAVMLNGEFIGSTPTSASISPSSPYELTLRKPHYVTKQTTLELPPGGPATRTFQLEKKVVSIDISSTPSALVRMNRLEVGQTPLKLEVSGGDKVEISHPDYASESIAVDSTDDLQKSYDFELITVSERIFRNAPSLITVANTLTLVKFPAVDARVSLRNHTRPGSANEYRAFELSRPFYFGKNEVTISEFANFDSSVAAQGVSGELPVNDVSWIDAAQFCNWLSQQEGLAPAYVIDRNLGDLTLNTQSLGYRLPTEAEWEAVAMHDFRSGVFVGPYPWGSANRIRQGVANFAGRELQATGRPFLEAYSDDHVDLAPVGSYARNVNGISDLAGNVSEWVNDYYSGYGDGLNTKRIDPLGSPSGVDHMVKGGNYRTNRLEAMYLHLRQVKTTSSPEVGFRVAKWLH